MIVEFIETLNKFFEQLVLVFGELGIAFIAILENLFPPTPSEFLYPFAGKMAYDGKVSIVGVIVAGVLGSMLASFVYYSLGRWLGEARTRDFITRYGTLHIFRLRWTWITMNDFETAMHSLKTRGAPIIILARIMPIVHSIVSIPAGIAKIPRWQFLLYTAIGSFLWIAPLSLLGMWLGSNWHVLMDILDTYSYVWYAIIALVVVYFFARRAVRNHQQREKSQQAL